MDHKKRPLRGKAEALNYRGQTAPRAVMGSIPTAPTIHLPGGWILSKITRGQKGADKANDPVFLR